jgi:hypothetical protein
MQHSTIANGIICLPGWLLGKGLAHVTWQKVLEPYTYIPHTRNLILCFFLFEIAPHVNDTAEMVSEPKRLFLALFHSKYRLMAHTKFALGSFGRQLFSRTTEIKINTRPGEDANRE